MEHQVHCTHVSYLWYSLQYGQTPVWTASFNGHQKCVHLHIEAGANVDVPREVSVAAQSRTHISEVSLQCITTPADRVLL